MIIWAYFIKRIGPGPGTWEKVDPGPLRLWEKAVSIQKFTAWMLDGAGFKYDNSFWWSQS